MLAAQKTYVILTSVNVYPLNVYPKNIGLYGKEKLSQR